MERPVLRSGLPTFCLERWQSERETSARVNLSESGVEPVPWDYISSLVGDLRVDLGYGWTRGSPGLREAIAREYYGLEVDAGGVVVSNGSAEANLAVVLALVGPGDTVVVDMPNYMQVHGLARFVGARIVEAWRSPGDGWRLPADEIIDVILEYEPRAVFITNPNNPTGSVDDLWDIVDAASTTGTIVVVDEVYRWLEHEGPPTPSVLQAGADAGARVVSVSGLSKAFGLPGLRIGWAATPDPHLARRIWAVRDYTTIGVSRLSEAVATVVVREEVLEDLSSRARSIVVRNLELFHDALGGLLEYVKPRAGAFVFARVPGVDDTMALAKRLYSSKGILVNPGECFEKPGYLRIGLGVASAEEARSAYEELARALEELVGG